MAKEISFDNPPEGHVGLLVHDADSDKWYAVLGDSDGHIILEVSAITLPAGLATSAKQLADGHNVTIDNASIAVTGTFWLATQPISAAALPLPGGAATDTKQTTQITALQSIQNLVGALHDVGLDELDVFIAGQASDIEVKQTAPADLTVAQHQYTGSAWVKSNLLWGYHDRWVEEILNPDASLGDNTVLSAIVPPDYVYVATNICVINWNTSCSSIEIAPYDGSTAPRIMVALNTTPEVADAWAGVLPLRAGDRIWAEFKGCAADDDLYLQIWGYKMKVDM